MKSLRWFLILMIFGLWSSAAMADSIDPAVGVQGGTDGLPFLGTATGSCVTNPCNIRLPVEGFFDNRTGANIVAFDFFWDQIQPGNEFFPENFMVREGSLFTILDVISPTHVRLSGAAGVFIPPCFGDSCTASESFALFVDGMNGTVTVTVPEPGTMILMLSGLGALGLRRLRRNKVPS